MVLGAINQGINTMKAKLNQTTWRQLAVAANMIVVGFMTSFNVQAQVEPSASSAGRSSACPESNTSFKCQQRRQVEAIWVDLNQSIGSTIETFTADPGTVFESGCLDDIASINFSIIRVDPASIWTELYNTLKDELINRTCSVLEDKINEHREALNLTLSAPFGLGSISIGEGTDIESTRDIFRFEQRVSNDVVRREVVDRVFGGRATAPQRDFSENRLELPNRNTTSPENRPKRSKKEESITKFVDLNKLWGKNANEDQQDQNQP